MSEIKGFFGDYRWLSNFHECKIKHNNNIYPSVENLYQAFKCVDINDMNKFVNITPKEAKQLGKKIKMRSDWDMIKLKIMEQLIRYKFTKNDQLKQKLIDTKDYYIEETNNWNDTFWGVCNNIGDNHLGKIIMKIRDEINNIKSLNGVKYQVTQNGNIIFKDNLKNWILQELETKSHKDVIESLLKFLT